MLTYYTGRHSCVKLKLRFKLNQKYMKYTGGFRRLFVLQKRFMTNWPTLRLCKCKELLVSGGPSLPLDPAGSSTRPQTRVIGLHCALTVCSQTSDT